MKLDPAQQARLQFLIRVVDKEARHLLETDQRLFADLFVISPVERLETDTLLAERVEAFVSRFGRLQDTLADKLLPALLDAMAEPRGASLENLDRAEKLGWLDSADQWLAMRKLRNQMVHEYIEDPLVLASALRAGHAFVPVLSETARRLAERALQRLTA